MDDIKVGSKVKSFDCPQYEDRRNHGIIGKVMAVNVTEVPEPSAPGGTWTFDCPRYAILIESMFDEGGVRPAETLGRLAYPPMNGTQSSEGYTCDGVEIYEEGT